MRIATASLVSVLIGSFAHSTSAAVRTCGPIVSSEIAAAPTEFDAKKKALEQWRLAALKRGTGYDSWRLAASKSLKCFPKETAKGGGFECVAFGAPCIVDQAPGSSTSKPRVERRGI